MAVERRRVAETVGRTPAQVKKVCLLSRLPALLEHCSATTYPDKSDRTPGWVMIGTRDGEWRVTCKDPDANASVSVQDPDLDTALAALEALVSSPETQWQIDPWSRAKPTKKRK